MTGDIALYEYANGAVLDKKNILLAVRYALANRTPERLCNLFSEDVVFETEQSTFSGPDETIKGLESLCCEDHNNFAAELSTVEGSDDAAHPAGLVCLALKKNDLPEMVLFVDLNENGQMTRICCEPMKNYRIAAETGCEDAELDNSMTGGKDECRKDGE